jgi:hypothetical protein
MGPGLSLFFFNRKSHTKRGQKSLCEQPDVPLATKFCPENKEENYGQNYLHRRERLGQAGAST